MRFGLSPCVAALTAVVALSPIATAQEADVLIRGGMILDGTGAESRRADIAVKDGRIAAVGDVSAYSASRVIDVSGLYVTPGFIDLHSHAETGISDPHLATAANNLTQGITTIVVGQDGRHAWPVGGSFADRVALWHRQGIGNNIVPLAGQGSARLEVMGWGEQPASEAERAAIAEHTEKFLEEGAWGLSSGLGYFDPVAIANAGVKVALNMDSASDFQKHLLHATQIAIRYGMDHMGALESVTINPPRFCRFRLSWRNTV